MKYLIWLVIALAVVVWLQRAKKSIAANAASGPGDAGRASRNPFARKQSKQQAETMVQCSHCGIHFPASESVANTAGAVFCSKEHLRLASS